jgi:hypothetical protein
VTLGDEVRGSEAVGLVLTSRARVSGWVIKERLADTKVAKTRRSKGATGKLKLTGVVSMILRSWRAI